MNNENEAKDKSGKQNLEIKNWLELKSEPTKLSNEHSAREAISDALYGYQLVAKQNFKKGTNLENYYKDSATMAKMFFDTHQIIKEQQEFKAYVHNEMEDVLNSINEGFESILEKMKLSMKGEDFEKFKEVFFKEYSRVYYEIRNSEDQALESLGKIYNINSTQAANEATFYSDCWKRETAMGFIEDLPDFEFKNLIKQLEREGYAKISWHKYMDNEPSEK